MMIEVSAAVIKNQYGLVLICQRGSGGSCANLWEFPGGKKEKNESLEDCLVRECLEELDLTIEVKKFLLVSNFVYPDKEIQLSFFEAVISSGILKPAVHQAFAWVLPEELVNFEFCPADVPMVKQLLSRGQK